MAVAIDPTSDRPVFKQIADHLRTTILSGQLAPGSRLPSEQELIGRYGVARGTIRQAVNLLRGEGLVRTEHGRGTFVRDRPPVRRLAHDRFARRHRVLLRRRRYLADGEPMEVATSYVPWSLAEGTQMTEPNTGPGGIYARLEEQGHRLKRFSEEVTARMPTSDEVRALRLEPGIPVMRVVRIAYDVDDVPVEACDTVMAADRYVLSYELPAR
jgi:GntR family transcriptional regulator